jgi:hypothetical protein
MSNRDFGVVALGRFLAVERYYETHVSPSANQPGVPARTGPAVTPPSRARGAAPGHRLGRSTGRGWNR